MKILKLTFKSLMIISMFSLFGCGQKEEFVQNIAVKSTPFSKTTTTLAWDPVTTREDGSKIASSDIGYKLYYGKVSKTYTDRIDVGSVTEYTLQNSDFRGAKYFFAVSSYSKSSGSESIKSDEISVVFP